MPSSPIDLEPVPERAVGPVVTLEAHGCQAQLVSDERRTQILTRPLLQSGETDPDPESWGLVEEAEPGFLEALGDALGVDLHPVVPPNAAGEHVFLVRIKAPTRWQARTWLWYALAPFRGRLRRTLKAPDVQDAHVDDSA